jgi:site-specific recombinase XerD
LISEYLEELRRQGRLSKTTVAITEGWLKRFEAWCAGRDLAALKAKDLYDWRQSLAWTPGPSGKLYSESTVNQGVLAVRAFYRWTLSQGRMKVDPAAVLKVRAVPRQPKPRLSGNQMRKFMPSPDLDTPLDIRDRAILGLNLGLGLAHGAISQLELDHIALDTGALIASGRRGGVYSLWDGLCADLERYLKEARPLLTCADSPEAFFLNNKGQRMSNESVSAVVERAHRRARLRP